MTAMMLADQGADVIKIEPPLVGDSARFMGSTRNGMGSMFAVLNRNKRSLVLDLKSEQDMEIFRRLADTADILIENYRPGVVEKLGIDYPTLSKTNLRLIYASISGYGQDGPYRNRRVYDPLIQATAGLTQAQGGNDPHNIRTIVFDKVTAMTAAQAVTTALLDREKTGQGQYLPISMLDSALYYSWPDVMWSRTLIGDGIKHAGELADYFQTFRAQDGHVSIVLVADAALELLCVWRGTPLHEDSRYRTLPDRLANAAEFKNDVEAMLAEVTTAEICENLDAFGVPVARVNALDEVHEDEQVRHARCLVETTHPVIGDMRFPRPPVAFNGQNIDEDAFPERHAPFLGDHTREILDELQFDEPTIRSLEEREAKNREILKAAMASVQGSED
jgi:crotonobetainyl-CoA:carnitine CoA-transferase CaiB-like acyl-CoA transferase